MFYVYILKSEADEKRYIGFTENLERRLKEHRQGLVTSTKSGSYYLDWYSGFRKKKKALEFEKYLKTGSGIAFINNHF